MPLFNGKDRNGNPEKWLEAARAGCSEALGKLLESQWESLRWLARQHLTVDLQGKASPSDLVQQTFLEAQRDFATFRGRTERELHAWLQQALLHNVKNFIRDTQRDRREVAREIPLDAMGLFGGDRGQPVADISSPSSQAVRSERIEALERALGRLPEHSVQVIEWRHRERRSFEEIGRLLHRSADAAKKVWSRAIETLREELRPHHGSSSS